MSKESSPDQPAFPRLDDDTILYRAAKNRTWLTDDRQKGTDLAFHRRPESDQHPDLDGLSFGLTPKDAVAGLSNPVPGVIRVRVGDLRALRDEKTPGKELQIEQDKPGHAVIKNLAFYDESDFVELGEAIRWSELIAAVTEVRTEDQLPRSYWKDR